MTEKPELAPCPFCGSEDLREMACAPSGAMSDFSMIVCQECHAQGPVADQIGDWTRPHKAWNNLPEIARLRAEIERKDAALKIAADFMGSFTYEDKNYPPWPDYCEVRAALKESNP